MLNLEESAGSQNRHEQIIDALRAEMQEYGGLLNLFDQQQNAILSRKPDEIADILLVLVCLANQTGVDLNQAIHENLAKKTVRDSTRHRDNPKLQQ